MRRALGLVLCGVITTGLGCAGDDKAMFKGPAAGRDSRASRKDAKPAEQDEAVVRQQGRANAPAPAAGEPARKPEKPVEKPRRRMIVYTGRVELVVEDYEAARYRLMELLQEHEGYEANSEQTGQPDETRRGVWTLRVPAAKFRSFLDAVSKLGELRRQTLESNDITDRYYDVQAEALNLEAREKALRKLYEEKIAGSKLADLIEVDRELSNVRGQINVRKGQMQRWEQETAFATITVELHSRQGYVPPTAAPFGTTVGRTFSASLDAMLGFGQGIVLFAVAVGPWLVPASVVAVPLWLSLRHRRRRQPAEAAPPVPPAA
jgi:hypothetical protein